MNGSVSRVLFALTSQDVAAIRLGQLLPAGSSSLPESCGGASRAACDGLHSTPIWPYSGGGFACRPCHQGSRCALTAPFHPYPAIAARRYVFCATLPERARARPVAVSDPPALWSPDFPRPASSSRPRLPKPLRPHVSDDVIPAQGATTAFEFRHAPMLPAASGGWPRESMPALLQFVRTISIGRGRLIVSMAVKTASRWPMRTLAKPV